MRLRRETGDFSIDVTNISEEPVVLPKNLSKEDLIGCIVTNGGTDIEIIIRANRSVLSNYISLYTSNDNVYWYSIESGELSGSEPDEETIVH